MNPVVVLDTIIAQVEAYDNLIPFVLDSLRYLTPLAFDVMAFVLVHRLSLQRTSVHQDGVNNQRWLISLANFTGGFFRKFYNTEIQGVLQFILNAAHRRDTADLLVLQELLGQMGSTESVENMSDAQILGQAGGPTLRAVSAVTIDATTGSSQRAAACLLKALTKVL